MKKLDAVRQRLVDLIAEHDTDMATVSKAIGKNHAYLQQFIHRADKQKQRKLPEDVRRALADHFGVPESDFGGPKSPYVPARALGIPEIDTRAGAGGGGVAIFVEGPADAAMVEALRGHWKVADSYLRDELRIREADARMLEVRGDSMAPTLQSGDRVLIDTTDVVPSPPGLFVLWDGLGIVVKRVEPVFPSEPMRYRISSDNPNHSAYERTEEEARLLGRVRMCVRRM
jgi:hypothetical protein